MSVGRIRVRSSRTPYRRGGLAFSNLPLVLGPEHFADGIAGLRQIERIVSDPVLKVQYSDPDTPDTFQAVPPEMLAALRGAIADIELAEDKSTYNEAASLLVAAIVGEKELQSPEVAEDEEDDAAASESDAGAKADGDTDDIVAPAVDTPPAPDAAAASGEQTRAGADASEAAPAADADAGKQPEDTQQPPVAATELHNPMEATAPAEAKAPADATPPRSSGRRSRARAADPAKG